MSNEEYEQDRERSREQREQPCHCLASDCERPRHASSEQRERLAFPDIPPGARTMKNLRDRRRVIE